MMKNISFRANEDIMREVEKLAKLEYTDKSLVLREALEMGLEEMKLKTALRLFAEGKASTSEAAEIADISVGEMMDKLTARGIKPDIDEADLKGSLETAMKKLR